MFRGEDRSTETAPAPARAEHRGFELLEYAEDSPSELASHAVELWRRRRRHCTFPRNFVEKYTPNWAWLRSLTAALLNGGRWRAGSAQPQRPQRRLAARRVNGLHGARRDAAHSTRIPPDCDPPATGGTWLLQADSGRS